MGQGCGSSLGGPGFPAARMPPLPDMPVPRFRKQWVKFRACALWSGTVARKDRSALAGHGEGLPADGRDLDVSRPCWGPRELQSGCQDAGS